MCENKNGIVGWLWIALSVIGFVLLAVGTAQAYSYNDYYDGNEEGNNEEDINEWDDAVGYYDYTGQWHEIPEPDPYPVSYSRGHRSMSPISMMMPLFIIFFVVFLPWLLALGRDEN